MALQPCMEWVSIKKVNKTGTGKGGIAYFNDVELQNITRTQTSVTWYGKLHNKKDLCWRWQIKERNISGFVKCSLLIVLYRAYFMIGKTWESMNSIFYYPKKQINFWTSHLALSNSHVHDNRSPKRPVIKMKACDNHTHNLNIVCGHMHMQSQAIPGQAVQCISFAGAKVLVTS